MTDDLDLDLLNRLDRLAAAVPVAPIPGLAPVALHRVRARTLAPGALFPVLAVVVVATLLAGLAGVGPFAPIATSTNGPSSEPGASSIEPQVSAPEPTASISPQPTLVPPTSIVEEGDFEFTLRASMSRFATRDMIDVVGELTYRGPEMHVTIRHGVWGPIEFSMAGLPRGVEVAPFSAPFACIDLDLQRGVPYKVPLRNFAGGVPQEFRLPARTWEVRGSADFHLDPDCHDPSQTLSTGISFDVAEFTIGVHQEVDDGTLGITIFTPRAAVHEGDPVTIFTTYRYVGADERGQILHVGPAVVFHVDQLNPSITKTMSIEPLHSSCSSDRLPKADVSVAFGDVREITAEDLPDDWLSRHFDGSRLRLPLGTWRISAFLVASTTDCVGADSPGLIHASIDVHVLPESAGAMPILTSRAVQTAVASCGVTTATGRIVRSPISGLALHRGNGTVTPVRWLFDMRAELGTSGAVLYDPNGFEFARENEDVGISGSFGPDGVFEMCIPVGDVEDPILSAPPDT